MTRRGNPDSRTRSDRESRFEDLTRKLLSRLLSRPDSQINPVIADAIRQIGEFFDLEWGILVQWGPDPARPVRTHEWTVSGGLQVPALSDLKPQFWSHLAAGADGSALFSRINDLPRNAAKEKALFHKAGVDALLSISLRSGGGAFGTLVFASRHAEALWPDAILRRLDLLGNLVSCTLDRMKTKLELVEQLRFQTLLTEISAKFVNLPADRVDCEISAAQRRICDSLDLDRCALWQPAENKQGSFQLTHLYQRMGVPPAPPGVDAKDLFPWLLQKALAGEVMVLPDLCSLPPEASRDLESFTRGGTKSSVVIPLSVGSGAMLGGLTFDSLEEERDWPEAFVRQLVLVAQVFANALARKRSDEALRESEAFVNVSLDAARAGIWRVQFAPPRMWVSPKMREMCHFAPDEELTPERFLGLVHPDDRETVDRIVRHAVETDTEYSMEHRVLLRDGSIRWVESRGRSQPHPPGEPRWLTGISMDITERKLAEAALLASEERFRTLIEQAPIPIGIGRGGKILHVNNKYLEVFGYQSVDELRGRPIIKQWAPQSRRDIREIVRRYELGLATPTELEAVARRKDGAEIILSAIVNVMQLSDGPASVAFFRDITESRLIQEAMRKAEEALRLSEARYRLLAENSTDVIWTMDLNGRFTYVSPSVERLRGFSVQAVRKQPLEEAFTPDSARRVREALEWLTANKSPSAAGRRLELEQPRKDGSSIWTEADISILHDDAGKVQGFLGHSRDITEKRMMEREVEHLGVQSRQAERVARMRIITASLAHELSQPLAAILSNAEAGLLIMEHEKPDLEELRAVLADIVGDDKRAANVIHGLHRILGRVEPRREKISLTQAIREVIALLQSDILEHGIAVDVSEVVDCAVAADKAQIQQVIVNLVMNAIEAMQAQPLDQRRLKFTVAPMGSKAQVAVCDSGPGIPDDQGGGLLVEPFKTTKSHALGVGLVICRSIVESHAGRIWFANNPDGGVTFYFALPMQKNEDAARQGANKAEE